MCVCVEKDKSTFLFKLHVSEVLIALPDSPWDWAEFGLVDDLVLTT